jgi:acetyltransferase-like isoleucine patch superfamily enzyme
MSQSKGPPTFGVIAIDVVFWLLYSVIVGGAFASTGWLWSLVPLPMPWSLLLIGPATLVFLLILIVEVAVLSRLMPRLRPGLYAFPGSPMAVAWMFSLLFQRILFSDVWRRLIMGSAVLRYLALRAMRANISFRTSMSSDVMIVDPGLIEIAPGAMLGGGCLLGGHILTGKHLFLGKNIVEEGAELHVGVSMGPGCRVGRGAVVGVQTMMTSDVDVGEGAVVGFGCTIRPKVVIEAGARVPDGTALGKGERVRA